jgi:hypothetical protein
MMRAHRNTFQMTQVHTSLHIVTNIQQNVLKRLPHYDAAANQNMTVPSPVSPANYGMQHARRPVTTVDHTASHH